MLRIQQDIDAAPGADWDFPDLARKNGMSYSQFRRRFREHSGQAPGHYLTASRMRAAAGQLQTGHDSIQQIGEAVGYPDPAHFSKVFKQHFGVSPRSYRQSIQQFQRIK
jgi:AraC-like DNA-binding protein